MLTSTVTPNDVSIPVSNLSFSNSVIFCIIIMKIDFLSSIAAINVKSSVTMSTLTLLPLQHPSTTINSNITIRITIDAIIIMVFIVNTHPVHQSSLHDNVATQLATTMYSLLLVLLPLLFLLLLILLLQLLLY